MSEKVKDFLLAITGGIIFFLFVNAIMSNGFYSNYKTSWYAMENADKFSKVGKATMTNYLGLIKIGDDSYQTALVNAGITKIHHVDMESQGWFGKRVRTLYVYGE